MPLTSGGARTLERRPVVTAGRRIAGAFAAGFGLSLVLLVLSVSGAQVPPPELGLHGYVTNFAPPTTGFEVLLLHGDGQAYASIALDPGLAHPERWFEGAPAQAFFAQRPLLSYLAWAGSGGDVDRLAPAFVVLGALAGGLLVAATAALLLERGRRWEWAIAVPLLPNVLFGARAFTPDVLATGLALAGLALWRRSPARGRSLALTTGCFVLAALARESTLVIPVVLVAYELWHRRFRPAMAAIVLVPGAAYVAWMLFVRHQLQTGPEKIARATSFSVPFVGLAEGTSTWTAVDLLLVLLLFGAIAVVAWRNRTEVEAWIIAAYLLACPFLNRLIWRSWEDIGRVLIPAAVLALILVTPPAVRAEGGLPIRRARL